MSTAALRRALELVDGQSPRKPSGRVARNKLPYQRHKLSTTTTEATVDKLLKLSSSKRPVHNADKIIERAIKGKPLQDTVQEEPQDTGSILFPQEDKKADNKKFHAE